MWRRRLLKLCFFLLLGAIVNIAVAWACACWHAEDAVLLGGVTRDVGNAFIVRIRRQPGWTRISTNILARNSGDQTADADVPPASDDVSISATPNILDKLPRWSRAREKAPTWGEYMAQNIHFSVEDAAGWP